MRNFDLGRRFNRLIHVGALVACLGSGLFLPASSVAQCLDDSKGVDLELIKVTATKPDETGTVHITVQYNIDITSIATFADTNIKIQKADGTGPIYSLAVSGVEVALGGSCFSGGGWGGCSGSCSGSCPAIGSDSGRCVCRMSPSGGYHGCRCRYPSITASVAVTGASSRDVYSISIDTIDSVDESNECNNSSSVTIP